MRFLFLVSLIWAISFGLIKKQLAGLDTTALGTVRIALSTLVFLPFLRPHQIPFRQTLTLATIGAIEFGITYILYMAAFRYLQSYQVALFAIFTPLWIALFESLATRRLPLQLILATFLTIAGAAIICWQSLTPSHELLTGFFLVQASNVCFALGQIWYRRIRPNLPEHVKDASLFAFLYIGALFITLLVSAITTDWPSFHPSANQWIVLSYLGIISSGLCFFWWNLGATQVNAATLAAFANAKVPLAIACSLLIFRETTNIPRLICGSALLAIAICIANRKL